MKKNKVTEFSFFMQVQTSYKTSTTYGAAKRRKRASVPEGRTMAVGADEGNSTASFESHLKYSDNANSTKAEDVLCLHTMTVTVMKVEFTFSNGTRIPGCDTTDQANAKPPYFQIKDEYNRTTRFCYVDTNHTLVSFGDELTGVLNVTGYIDNVVPNIKIEQKKNPHCCGGVFYTKYSDKLATKDHYATSPDYPKNYESNMRCPYIFRCIPEAPAKTCTVQVDFIDFKLDSSNAQAAEQLSILHTRRHRREASNSTEATNSTDIVPANQGFNKCTNSDFIRIGTCNSITGLDSELLCSKRHPLKSFTGEKQILLYFQSDHEREDAGFVASYVSLDPVYGIYTKAELNASCQCGKSIPRLMRVQEEKLNTSNKDKKMFKKKRKQRKRKIRERRTANEKQAKRESAGLNKKRRMKKPTDTRKIKPTTNESTARSQIGGMNSKGTIKKKGLKPATGLKRKKEIKIGAKNGQRIQGRSKNLPNKTRRRKKNPAQKKTKHERLSRPRHLRKKKVENTARRQARISKGNKIKDPKESRFVVSVIQRGMSLIKKKKKPTKRSAPNSNREDTRILKKGKTQKSTGVIKKKVKKDKKPDEKKKNKFVVVRQCTANVLNSRYILTSTSCCTYCAFVWNKKYRKKQATTHSANGSKRHKREEDSIHRNKNDSKKKMTSSNGNNHKPKNIRPKKRKGNKQDQVKKATRSGNMKKSDRGKQATRHHNKKKSDRGKQATRHHNKKKSGQGKQATKHHNKKKSGRGKQATRQNNKKKTDRAKQAKKQGKIRAKQSKKGIDKKKQKKKQKQKQKAREKKRKQRKRERRKRRKQFKYRDPKKTDIYIIAGESKLKPKKLKTYKIVKPKEIFIPESCYLKMNITEKDGLKYYPMDCPVVIELGKPMILGDRIQPVCLPAFDTLDFNKETGATVGFGKKSPDRKKMVVSPKILTGMKKMSAANCQKSLKRVLHEDMFCTTTENGGSNCEGDWGNGLLSYKPTETGHGEHITINAVLAQTGCSKRKKEPKKKDKKEKNKENKKKTVISREKRDDSKDEKESRVNKKEVVDKDKKRRQVRKKTLAKDNANSERQNGRQGRKKSPAKGKANSGKKNPAKGKAKSGKKNSAKVKANSGKKSSAKVKANSGKKRGEKKNNARNGLKRKQSGNNKTRRNKQRLRKKGKGGSPKKLQSAKKKKKLNKNTDDEELVLTMYPKRGIAVRAKQKKKKGKNKKKKNNKTPKQPKKYNKKYNNGKNIDTWTSLGRYMTWILKIVYHNDDHLLCQRPLDFASSPGSTNTSIIGKCHAFPAREGPIVLK